MLFIHGYGVTHGAWKFNLLKEYFSNEFNLNKMDWDTDSDIESLLNTQISALENCELPVIIGDSTGANFAYQFREKRKSLGKKSILILTSPLLVNQLKIPIDDIPQSFINQLIEYPQPEDALIIASPEDDTLNLAWLWERELENAVLVQINDHHELHKFPDYLPMMKNYIDRF